MPPAGMNFAGVRMSVFSSVIGVSVVFFFVFSLVDFFESSVVSTSGGFRSFACACLSSMSADAIDRSVLNFGI